MRKAYLGCSKITLMHRLISVAVCLLLNGIALAQLPQNAFSFNCTRDTTLACGQNCLTLRTTVPVIRAVSNQYSVSKAACFRPNVSPATPAISLAGRDDLYSPVIPLPFNFPFYNIIYNQLVISTNGMISFDITNAQSGAQWTILNGEGTLPTDAYDRAIIMGAYHDIDIENPNTSPDKQIKYEVTGTAPHRKWVLSFYKVPCFQQQCWDKINNTYQMTLYEGLGLVEIHVFGREICTTWNNGNAMIGMQNYEQDNGIMAPGRSAWTSPQWGGVNMNEAWRFAPNAGPSLLKSVELYKSTGEFVAMGDTANDGNGNYNVSFNTICQDLPAATYIVKSSYYHCEYPLQVPAADSIVYATDTINVFREGEFTQIRYPKNIYCSTENLQEAPVVDGVSGGVFRADAPGLSIDSVSGVIDIAASDTGFYTVQYRIATSDPCVTPVASTTVHIVDPTKFVWTGAVDNSWENPANWSCNNLPQNGSNVFIYAGTVVINSNVTINSLYVSTAASVVITPGFDMVLLNAP